MEIRRLFNLPAMKGSAERRGLIPRAGMGALLVRGGE
jgi:hypothetical protein